MRGWLWHHNHQLCVTHEEDLHTLVWDGWDDEWRRWSPARVRRPDQSWLMIKINIACFKESLFSQSLFASHTNCFMVECVFLQALFGFVVGVIVHNIELWMNRYFGLKKEKVVIFPISWSRSHPHWGERKKGEGRPRHKRVASRHCYQFKTGNTSIVMNCNVARSEWGPALPGVTVTASREGEISFSPEWLSHSTRPGVPEY